MASDFSKILDHPDKDEIISQLIGGIAPKEVSNWLKLKYPQKDQAHLRVSGAMLQTFLSKHANLAEHLREHIQEAKEETKIDKRIYESLLDNKSYKERLNALADEEIDIKQVVKDTLLIIRERSMQMFDLIQQDPTSKSLKPDYALIKYFEILLNAIEKFDKIHNNAPDQVIQHNITVEMIEQQSVIFQEAFRRVLAQLDQDHSMHLIELFNKEMRRLQPPAEDVYSSRDRLEDAKLLKERVENGPTLEEG